MRREVWRIDGSGADATQGRVAWAPGKSAWNTAMLAGALVLGPATATPGAVAMFAALTYATLLLGHSVGMHRFLIHRTYEAPKWVQRTLIALGTMVGMAGPLGVIRIHDTRDWAQRMAHCHDFFSHRRGLLVDAFWQLHCRFEFARPPRLVLEPDIRDDPWIAWMERTWMLQQVPMALVLFAIGGLPWVVWGVCCRVSASVVGHWVVTYYCHNPGPGRWKVRDAGVQASNIPGLGLLTMGECWHNNHHAFPESARMGLESGETDPGYEVLLLMRSLGLAWNLGEPREHRARDDLLEARSDERFDARSA